MVEAGARLGGIAAERPLARVAGRALGSFGFAALPSHAAGSLVSEWVRLAARPAGDNVFFHPDFAIPAMRHLGSSAVSIASVTVAGTLVGIAPFTRTRLGWIAPAVRLWSHPYGPLGLPLIASDSVDDAIATLVEGLAPHDAGTSLIVPDLPLDGPVADALSRLAETAGRPTVVLGGHVRAVLDRPAGGAVDLRSGLPTRRRKEYARQMRRLGELGRVTIETAVEPEHVRSRFEEFVVIEAAGWKGRGGTALASESAIAEFARAAVSNRADAGAARIHSIRIDDRPIAVLVSLLSGTTAFTWKIAYDETYARFSPGVQLMMEAAKSLLSDPSVARIDSCAAADHPMVDRVWPGRMAIGTLVIGPPGGGVVYRLGVAAASIAVAARDRAHRLRERLS